MIYYRFFKCKRICRSLINNQLGILMHFYKSFLKTIYKSSNDFGTPVYQRHYEWKRINWERLWNTLLKGYFDKDIHDYSLFLGTIILQQKSHQTDLNKVIYEIIDGQQRIVTIALLLAAMRTQYPNDDDQKSINKLLLQDVSKYKSNVKNSRIIISYKDNPDFNYIINGMIDRVDQTKMLYKCYDHFVQTLKNQTTPINLNSFLDILFEKYFVTVIKLDENEIVGPIFETVNAYAMPLDTLDNIRSFIFSWLNSARIDTLYTNCWTVIEKEFDKKQNLLKFISQFLEMRTGKQIGYEMEYEALSSYLRSDDEKIQESNIESFLFDLLKFLPFQKLLDNPDQKLFGLVIPDDIRYQLSKLKLLDTNSYYPFLFLCLNRYYDFSNKKISDEKSLKLIFSYIETIFIRRFICCSPNRPLADWFINLCNKATDDPILSLPEILENNSIPILPKDDVFKVKVGREAIYCDNYKSTCRLLLSVIEDYLSLNTPGYSAIGKKLDIEHIMPQNIEDVDYWKGSLGEKNWKNIHDSWVHTLGNLALIAREPNIWASNDSLPVKYSIYQQCKTALLDSVENGEKFGLEEIKKRASLLTNASLIAWPYFANIIDPEIIPIWSYRKENKLKSFHIKDEKQKIKELKKTCWKDIHYKTIEILYRVDPDRLLELIKTKPFSDRFSMEPNKFGKSTIKLNDVEFYYKKQSSSEIIYKQCTELKREMNMSDSEWFIKVEFEGKTGKYV